MYKIVKSTINEISSQNIFDEKIVLVIQIQINYIYRLLIINIIKMIIIIIIMLSELKYSIIK